MSVTASAIALSVSGGLILYSGVKGATIADTVKAALSGNLTVKDTETISFGSSSANGSDSGTSGAAILADAEKYNGHKYVYGGPSNPDSGWDCSSFASYVLGHDLGMQLPGGKSWKDATNNGNSHGPVASEFANTPGFKKAGSNPAQNQAGDLLVWSGHVGFGDGNGGMFSAYDTAQGTLQTTPHAPYPFVGVYRIQSNSPAATSSSPGTGNATFIYKFLRSNGYQPVAAAAAVAVIAGEGTNWNPEAVGTGGAGLIGWTPPSSMIPQGGTCHAAGIGNNSDAVDLQNQCTAILNYVSQNGMSQYVSMMNQAPTVLQAAQIWSASVEKPAIKYSDIHSGNIQAAITVAKNAEGVNLR